MKPARACCIRATRPYRSVDAEERPVSLYADQYIGRRQPNVGGPSLKMLMKLLSEWERNFVERRR